MYHLSNNLYQLTLIWVTITRVEDCNLSKCFYNHIGTFSVFLRFNEYHKLKFNCLRCQSVSPGNKFTHILKSDTLFLKNIHIKDVKLIIREHVHFRY